MKNKKVDMAITQNIKNDCYDEFEVMMTVAEMGEKSIKVCDFIFDKLGEVKKIKSEIEKDKLKKYMNEIIDKNFSMYKNCNKNL